MVFAGASQFVVLDLWLDPLPVGAIVLAALAVNLRHVLMGAAMRPWLAGLSPFTAYGSLFFLVDESWALSMREVVRGKNNIAFLVGSGMVLFLLGTPPPWWDGSGRGPCRTPPSMAWTSPSRQCFWPCWPDCGGDGEIYSPGAWRPWPQCWPINFLPGKWYILIGALAGSLTVAARRGN